MFVQNGVHLRRPWFTHIWLFYFVWREILTTSTPSKPHIPDIFEVVSLLENFRARFYSSFGLQCPQGQVWLRAAYWKSVSASLLPMSLFWSRRAPRGGMLRCRLRWSPALVRPSFCEFTGGPVLIVETSTQSVAFLDLHRLNSHRCVYKAGLFVLHMLSHNHLSEWSATPFFSFPSEKVSSTTGFC